MRQINKRFSYHYQNGYFKTEGYTNADLKISLHVNIHMKIIP